MSIAWLVLLNILDARMIDACRRSRKLWIVRRAICGSVSIHNMTDFAIA